MMKKYLLIALCALFSVSAFAQEKVMRIYYNNGKSRVEKASDILKVAFEDAPESEWPEDPNPPTMGYLKSTFTDGELMYYGKDPVYSKDDAGIYFLYLKDLNNKEGVNSSVCFYVNVPRQPEAKTGIPDGTYKSASSWEIGTFNDLNVEKYVSNWYVVNPKQVNYRVEDGEFVIEKLDATTYSVKGRVKGGSMQDNGSIATNEYGIEFSYTGPLPIEDYSDIYEQPEEPEQPEQPDPDTPDIPENAIEMTTGEYYYYGDNEYYLNLKDQKPRDTYEITLYLYSNTDGTFGLKTGEYTPQKGGADFTIDPSTSTWTFVDHDDWDEVYRPKIDAGTVNVVAKGNHEYEIYGTVKSTTEAKEFSFKFSGTLPFEDYSY